MGTREDMARLLDLYLNSSGSRRTFLRSALAAGGLAALAPPAAAAGDQAHPGSSAPRGDQIPLADETTWASSPVRFAWVDFAEPTAIDPAVAQDSSSFSVTHNVYDTLYDIDLAKLQLVPSLAADYALSEDGKTYTFTLREGVQFHSGNDFTTADVKATLDRMKAINQGQTFLIANVTAVTVVDPKTVAVATAEPDPFLPAHLAKIGIVSAKTVAANVQGDDQARGYFAEHADGTGPYKLENWEKGAQITLAKNGAWWRGWQPGSIDTVDFRWSGEASTRVQMLERGEADLIAWIPVPEAIRVGKSPGFTLVPWQTFVLDPCLFLNTKTPPTDNVKLRQALAAAFDYQAVVDYNQGYATIPTGPMPPDAPGGAQDLPPFKQDLAKAKQLLQESGLDPTQLVLNFVVPSGFAEFAFGATVLQASVKDLGITVKISEMPWAQMLQLYSQDKPDAHITDFAQGGTPLDPIQFLAPFYVTGAEYNMAKYSNPDVDAMIAKATTTIDEAERNQLLAAVQHQVVADAANIWGCRPQTLDAVPERVVGYQFDPTDAFWATRFYLIRIKQA